MNPLNRRAAVAGLALLALPLVAAAQGANGSVTWTSRAEPVKGAAGKHLYRLQFEGHIEDGYIVYGSDFEANLGPNPTRVRFDAKDSVTAQGKLESTGTKPGKDKAFNTPYTFFEGTAKLSQLVAVGDDVRSVTGTIRGQACHESDGTCTLFSAKFEVALP